MRGPFVQGTLTNSTWVGWRFPNLAPQVLEYGLSESFGNAITNNPTFAGAVNQLTNLLPNTRYFYRVTAATRSGPYASPIFSINTLSTSGPVRFTVVGDTGGGDDVTEQLADQMILRHPDLVLNLGDITAGGFRDSSVGSEFYKPFQKLMNHTPVYTLAGNHDVISAFGGSTNEYLAAVYLPTNNVNGSELFYSFDHGDVHFVCLFSPGFPQFQLMEGDQQYQWLTNDLAASDKPWKLLFLHTPIADSGPHYNNSTSLGLPVQTHLMDLLLPIAESFGVQMVFGSHDHNFQRFAPTNSLHHCVTGGGGRPLYSFVSRHMALAQFWSVYHFLSVSITNDTMQVEAIDYTGRVFDGLTIHRQLTPRQTYASTWHTPVIENPQADDGDGNINGQRFDFAGSSIPTQAGRFSNLGRVYVNNDATHLYIGFEHLMLYGNNNLFLFLESPHLSGVRTLAGLGNGRIDPLGQGVDGLDCLENLSFTNFAPAFAGILGDEYADGHFRSHTFTNLELNIGQGIFRLDTELTAAPGTRLQQFNRTPQTNTVALNLTGANLEQTADYIEIAIPYTTLGDLTPGEAVKLGALAGGGSFDPVAQTRELDRSVLGYSLFQSEEKTVLEGVQVQLAFPPLQLSITPLGADSYRLTWDAVPQRYYTLEFSTSLTTFIPWNTPSLPRQATGSKESIEVTVPSDASTLFFRIKQLP